MPRTKLLQYEGAQAVRLPAEVAFPEDVGSVVVVKDGKRRIITPADSVWDDFFDAPGVDLGMRDQPEAEVS
jgi:antitoxin VapB